MSKSFFKVGKLSGKGAAAVIVFCLTAVAAAGVYTYNKSEVTKEKLNSNNESVHTEDYLNAEAEKQDVPKNEAIESEEYPTQDKLTANEENTTVQTENNTETEVQKSAFENEGAVESGILVRPADGDIICEFSNGELVKSETLNVWKTHDGIDIAAAEGTPIRSVAQGVVTAVYDDPLWGNCISIEHDGGYESYYMGVSDTIYVNANETVNAGTEIAEVGNSADAEALEEEHLHFALKKDGNWVDPAEALSGLGS